jgi:cellulose biosynthesis protein BcsQ
MAQIITLYNHKGGVSKTTTTYHLAQALAEHLNKKVLVVDGDPQCNVTELCLSQVIEELDEEEEHGTHTDLPGTTVREALWPRLEGDRPDVDVAGIKLSQPDPSLPLFLMRGDIALSEAEDRLSYAHSQRLTTDMHQKRNYIAIHDMLRRLGERDKFDIILVDVGPSAGALTRSFFLACDRFLVPVAPDRFNLQAIGSLKAILEKWISEHSQVVGDFSKLGLNVARGRPEFFGLIMQRFQRHAGSPKRSYKMWIDRISERTAKELIPSLISVSGKDGVEKQRLVNPVAVEVPDFGSIAPMMLARGKPAWRLTQADTDWRGNVWEDRAKAMKEIRELFFALSEMVVA